MRQKWDFFLIECSLCNISLILLCPIITIRPGCVCVFCLERWRRGHWGVSFKLVWIQALSAYTQAVALQTVMWSWSVNAVVTDPVQCSMQHSTARLSTQGPAMFRLPFQMVYQMMSVQCLPYQPYWILPLLPLGPACLPVDTVQPLIILLTLGILHDDPVATWSSQWQSCWYTAQLAKVKKTKNSHW